MEHTLKHVAILLMVSAFGLALSGVTVGCGSSNNGSGGGNTGGGGSKPASCPGDEGIYAPPNDPCPTEGATCHYGDTTCVNSYVCEQGKWSNQGCSTSSSSTTGSGGADGGP
jgi:hypothetical protein